MNIYLKTAVNLNRIILTLENYKMKTTVTLNDFRNAFNAIRPNNFSYEGLEQLFNYFESYEDDTGEQIELDVIAICCEYQESTIEEIVNSYDIELDPDDDTQVNFDKVFAYLADNTSVIGHTDDSIIFQSF
jgi:hypothetical protein